MSMTTAPPLDCVACDGTIAKRRGHNLTDDGRVLCSPCLFVKANHARLWPSCDVDWHDVFDHLVCVSSTRAGIAARLGIWPERTSA